MEWHCGGSDECGVGRVVGWRGVGGRGVGGRGVGWVEGGRVEEESGAGGGKEGSRLLNT